MNITDLRTKSIAIVGFGQEGQAVAEYLHKLQISFAIFDSRLESEINNDAVQILQKFQTKLISFTKANLENLSAAEIIFRSPGVPIKHPLLLDCQAKGSIITSQTEYFFQNFSGHIIGVTGTKGKGTTSSLIYELLLQGLPNLKDNNNIFLTGNIGKVQPLQFLDETSEDTVVVYELSSFQLHELQQSPKTAVVLMVTQDHLDHHKDLQEYHEAKSSIAKFQKAEDIVVYNHDYEPTTKIGEASPAQKWCITSKSSEVEQGVAIKDSALNVFEDSKVIESYDCSNRLLRGQHNMENIAAAVLAVKQFNLSREKIIETINSFNGLEHRLEFAGQQDGITFINDSIATLPESTLVALKAFSEPTILILGGSDKGLNFENFTKEINSFSNLKAILFFGETGRSLQKMIFSDGISRANNFMDLGHETNLHAAMKKIKSVTESGDVVLLSPAAASFDQFKNYKERGQIFKDLVKEWQTL